MKLMQVQLLAVLKTYVLLCNDFNCVPHLTIAFCPCYQILTKYIFESDVSPIYLSQKYIWFWCIMWDLCHCQVWNFKVPCWRWKTYVGCFVRSLHSVDSPSQAQDQQTHHRNSQQRWTCTCRMTRRNIKGTHAVCPKLEGECV